MAPKGWPLAGVGLALGLAGCRSAEPAVESGPRAGQIDSACAAVPVPSALRRLTRVEYAAAIEDVFGLTLDVAAALPRDEVVSGFDNHAASLGVTDLHVEAFLKLAEEVGARVAGDSTRLQALAGCG